jgi:hypothetical protein
MTDKAKPNAANKVPVRLLKPHTHRGVEQAPGATLRLRPDQRDRLVAAKIAVDCAECDGPAASAADPKFRDRKVDKVDKAEVNKDGL